MNRLHIFAGHFGSGKTEISLNFAIDMLKIGKKVTIVDLDTVNPYFRTIDVRDKLHSLGIRVIASEFAGSNVDMPTVPPDVLGVFEDTDQFVIFDVGGDDDGAYALGQYHRFFSAEPYEMHFVINTKRIMTSTADDILEIAYRIQNASRLNFTDIYNNSNLGNETTTKDLISNENILSIISEKLNIAVKAYCGTDDVVANLPDKYKDLSYKIKIQLKKPWEIQQG